MFELKKFYNILYPHLKFEGKEALAEKLNVILIVSKYTKAEQLQSILATRDFRLLEKRIDNFLQFETVYIEPKTKEKIPVRYYVLIDEKNSLLVLFTTANKQIIERTFLNKVVQRVNGFYYSWISPSTLQSIKERIFKKYPSSKITYFIVKRKPTYKFQARVRPYENRTIEYSGSDGKDTLEEFRQIYGMLPHLIEFHIPDKIRFRIDIRGIFSFQEGDISFLDETFNFASNIILAAKRILDQSKLNLVEIKKNGKSFIVPDVEQWSIRFSHPIFYEEVGTILKNLSEEAKFSAIDNFVEKGSLFWSATIVDAVKNSIFTIKANGERLFVLPKYNKSFDSFLRFFEFFAENVDSEAVIERG